MPMRARDDLHARAGIDGNNVNAGRSMGRRYNP
jgi:hypothetical protein